MFKGTERTRQAGVALTIGITVTALLSASMHFALGSLMFYAAAAGYAVLVAALLAPIEMARRFQWLTRLALAGMAAGSIGAWFVMNGARYTDAYVVKVDEALLIVLVLAASYLDRARIIAFLGQLRALVAHDSSTVTAR